MSETLVTTDHPKWSIFRWRFVLAGLLVATLAIVIVKSRQIDDATLELAMARKWTAIDPHDAVFHRRDLPVASEQLDIHADGTLNHIIELASNPGNPENDLWGWKISKGRLYVQYRGEDAGGQWLPGFSFSVSDRALSIRIKGRLPKAWVRR